MTCNIVRTQCLYLNGRELGCKGCPVKKAYNKGVRDTKKALAECSPSSKQRSNRYVSS